MSGVEEAVSRAHQEEWARVVASLARRFGDLDIAEDVAAEAFAAAVVRGPAAGVPANPGGWLTTIATATLRAPLVPGAPYGLSCVKKLHGRRVSHGEIRGRYRSWSRRRVR